MIYNLKSRIIVRSKLVFNAQKSCENTSFRRSYLFFVSHPIFWEREGAFAISNRLEKRKGGLDSSQLGDE